MSSVRRFGRQTGLLTRQAPGFVALGHVDGTSITLNESAAAVWGLLDQPRTLTEMADALARAYDVDPDRIATDIAPLLTQLEEAGYVTADA